MELGVAAETKKPTSVVLMLKSDNEKLAEKFDKLNNKLLANNPYLWSWLSSIIYADHNHHLSASTLSRRSSFAHFGKVTSKPGNWVIKYSEYSWAFLPPAQHRRLTPFDTSHNMKSFNFSLSFSSPVNTMPKPPFRTYPHPVPPPLCKATHVAPLRAVPTKFWTLISAQIILPSRTEAVYLYGLSAPETSWWSLDKVTGPEISPFWIASEKDLSNRDLATASA